MGGEGGAFVEVGADEDGDFDELAVLELAGGGLEEKIVVYYWVLELRRIGFSIMVLRLQGG